MNTLLSLLQPYPFERLKQLHSGIEPVNMAPISLSIGEPKHLPPEFVINTLSNSLDKISVYPKTQGTRELRHSISHWLEQRFHLPSDSINPEQQVLPLNGTREGLFSFIQASVSHNENAHILMPNPFYQIYEGAALLAGATPVFLNCLAENNYQPDYQAIDEQTWRKCQVLILCSPGNPTGAVTGKETLIQLIKLADQYDFVIASDECYSEIYFDETNPPAGLLEACAAIGRYDYHRCVVFHSLSKRSNLPGLRSGFIAGDKAILKEFLRYRTYHGCAMPEPTQMASAVAWQDEQHVIENRKIYTRKFQRVLETLDGYLDLKMPEAAFYFWASLPDNDEVFCRNLFAQQHVIALPGQFLSRNSNGVNPGTNHARMALVATEEECIEAAMRIKTFMQENYL